MPLMALYYATNVTGGSTEVREGYEGEAVGSVGSSDKGLKAMPILY